MPNERDEREEPRFKIIDNRLLSDDERTGKLSSSSSSSPIIGASNPEEQPTPKLEIIGGGQSHMGSSSLHEEAGQAVSAPIAAGDAADATETTLADGYDDEDDVPMTQEEADQMREQIEQEQFAALEQQFGRPLTENEKEQVRALMDKQAESMTKLEMVPVLLQTVTEIPRFAAVHLGLTPNPYTGIIARNDAEARLAIDAFGALYDVLKTRLDARTGAELARVLNDLRVNYTRITGVSFPPAGGSSNIIGGPRIIR
jgi:hypothetical protein